MIKIYGTPKSRAFRCYWTLEELDIPYEIVPVEFGIENPKRDRDYLSVHSLGKIPAMVDTENNLTLFESSAICCYLANKSDNKSLLPDNNSKSNGEFLQWISFITTELEQPLWLVAKHQFALPKEYRLEIEGIKKAAHFEYKRCMDFINNYLEKNTYLVDNKFSVADILLVHTFMWAKMSGFDYMSEKSKEYYQRIRGRAAVKSLLKH